MTKPFNIKSSDISRLSDIQLTQLLNDLLHAEAYEFGLAQSGVEVALNINVGDGGEDGLIEWQDGPPKTNYVPCRLTMFQNKATDKGPAGYANEIVRTKAVGRPPSLKPRVEEVLDAGGAYIVFTTTELNKQQKLRRITAVRKKLIDAGKKYAETCIIRVYDAAQIASWVNQFISTIVNVQSWGGLSTERGLKNFRLWSQDEELSRLSFISVESRKAILKTLTESIEEPKSCFRLMGLSGLGKTRTAFQVFKDNEYLRSLVVYFDASHSSDIHGLVADWVSLNRRAVIVVDNCEYRLHDSLVREVVREGSQVSLLTLDYNIDSVSMPTKTFKLEPMSNDELLLLLEPEYKEQLPDLDRIVDFAQGFPQMAVLLAEARLAEDPRIGELTQDQLAQKLLWRHGEAEDPTKEKILRACSLFDSFGIEAEVENQLEFISKLIDVDADSVFECLQDYTERGLIDRRGRTGQVVPKPLAIRLAGQWWTKSRNTKKQELIAQIPPDMVEGFCNQVEKMDFHSDVKELTQQLCGPKGPFGQTEVILSSRGSRFFRSFVDVNPYATAEALYQVISPLSRDQLFSIEGDTRRNLVWALEKLCYHEKLFTQSAWCLLLLAMAENETWSNNATGMFAQLYRVQLSGTAAPPELRFSLLDDAINMNSHAIDKVVIQALAAAIRTFGGSRTVGAEYQGTKPPLQEWHPKIWQEVFDFWQLAFNRLLALMNRGDEQKQEVLHYIGDSIRPFVARGQLSMLDSAIQQVVAFNGPYWPEALSSIKHTFQYDAEKLNQEAKDALNSWLELLNPKQASLSEKLKIIVTNPPWEHKEDSDGRYIDVSEENAKKLARELSSRLEELLANLNLIFTGEQKQAYIFGYELAKYSGEYSSLVDESLNQISKHESPNISFALGVYRAEFEYSKRDWQKNIDRLVDDKHLVKFYVYFIRTGQIQKFHLERFLELIDKDHLLPESSNVLSSGQVTNSLNHEEISDFCINLARRGEIASWSALNIIYMYCFGDESKLDTLRDPLKEIVTTVPLWEQPARGVTDGYQWSDLIEKLLRVRDKSLVLAIGQQLIKACTIGFNHNQLWTYYKPILLKLMKNYEETLWPILGDAIASAEGKKRYWLKELVEHENSFSNKMPSVLSFVSINKVINWCKKNPDSGPSFVANSVGIIEDSEEGKRPSPLFIALLENFGDKKQVRNALSANIASRGWTGSLVPHLESDKKVLSTLLDYKDVNVRGWVKNHIANTDKQIEFEKKRDEEKDIGFH